MSEINDLGTFCRSRYRLAPARIAMLRFLVEGYDGILFLSTVDATKALVELSWSTSCAVDAVQLVAVLCHELEMCPCDNL